MSCLTLNSQLLLEDRGFQVGDMLSADKPSSSPDECNKRDLEDYIEFCDGLSEVSDSTENKPVKAKRNKASSSIEPNAPSRTIYLGGVTPEIRAHDILNHVHGGAVEAVRIVTEKGCAFIDFVNDEAALLFYNRLTFKRMNIRGTSIRVGWAKPTAMSENVQIAIKNGASRCICIGNLTNVDRNSDPVHLDYVKDQIFETMSRFGTVDQIRLVPERALAYAHLTNVTDAMRAVNVLGSDESWAGHKVYFGRDRCLAESKNNKKSTTDKVSEKREEGQIDEEETAIEEKKDAKLKPPIVHPIRTIYLGGISAETTAEDLCNVVRGGLIEKIRITPEKRCAFVTFIEPLAAAAFFEYANQFGITVKGNQLRAGWGQASAIPNAVAAALRQGATRNIYIGNIDTSKLTVSELHGIFSAYGQVELINFLRKDREIAFVNFCNILDAVKAIEGVRKNPMFRQCNISFGKDRCAQALGGLLPERSMAHYDERVGNNLSFGNYPYDHHHHLLQYPSSSSSLLYSPQAPPAQSLSSHFSSHSPHSQSLNYSSLSVPFHPPYPSRSATISDAYYPNFIPTSAPPPLPYSATFFSPHQPSLYSSDASFHHSTISSPPLPPSSSPKATFSYYHPSQFYTSHDHHHDQYSKR